MPPCEADQCVRESTCCVVLNREGESREFRLCGPHARIASWDGHHGGLNTGDGRGRWRPRKEVYYYEIDGRNGVIVEADYFGLATLSSTIENVQTLARGRMWRIYTTEEQDEVGQPARPRVGELVSSSFPLGPAGPALALWRRIEEAAVKGRGVKLSWEETDLLTIAGILSEIEGELKKLDVNGE